jgi:uncharacterized membrane protein YhiD involved in acid resistance
METGATSGYGLVHHLRTELLLEMGLAVVLGGLVGLERELRNKPAGLRTNILICLGCAVFSDLSHRLGGEGGDPGRIAAEMVAGLGFLGAGAILHARGDVIGLTTAATVWVVAAIGMALGFGAYLDATAATVLVLMVLSVLGRVETRLGRREVTRRLAIGLADDAAADQVLETARTLGLKVESHEATGPRAMALTVRGRQDVHSLAADVLARAPGVSALARPD